MDVFQIAYIVVICTAIYSISSSRGIDWRKRVCVLLGIVYFVIAAIRSSKVGGDSFNYVNFFSNMRLMSFSQMLQKYKLSDPLFFSGLWMIRRITPSYTVLFSIVAIVFMYSLMRFVYKYSDNPTLTWIIVLALSIYQFSLTAMRQTIAIAIILFAFDNYFEERKIKATILSCVAAMFHLSAFAVTITFLILVFIKKRSILIITPIMLLIVLGLNTNLARILSVYLNSASGKYEMVGEGGGGLTMALIIFVLYGISVYFCFSSKTVDALDINMASLAFVGLFFEMLVPVQPIYFRFAFYYLPVLTVYLPRAICKINNARLKGLVNLGVFLIMSIQYLVYTKGSCSVLPYTPFWHY